MVDGFRFEVFRRGKDVVALTQQWSSFSGTEGDFMTVIGTRGFDEFFCGFNAADGTRRKAFDASGKVAAAGTDVNDRTSHLPREAWILFL